MRNRKSWIQTLNGDLQLRIPVACIQSNQLGFLEGYVPLDPQIYLVSTVLPYGHTSIPYLDLVECRRSFGLLPKLDRSRNL